MSPKNWQWLALAGVVVAAIAVRCYRLDTPVLSHDESFSWRLTQYPVGELCVRTGLDAHPPLYYVLLKFWDDVFGESVAAIRGLSVLLGVAAVLLGYAVCLEALRDLAASSDDARRAVETGALFVALLLALSSGQMEAARNTRMYSLGVFFAGVSGWLLLRACRADANYWRWWAAYGLAAALFCYTHNYAFFTLFGQGLFVVVVLCSKSNSSAPSRARILLGFGYATLLAGILYLPWLPVLLEQMRRMHEGFWMEQVTVPILENTMFTWGTGLTYEGEVVSRIWLTALAIAVAFALWRSTRIAVFFVVQAFCPLAMSAAFSLASGSSIFHDHLFVFGQFYLVAFWGVVWAALPGWLERLALAVVMIGMNGTVLATKLANFPESGPAIAEAAAFVAQSAESGDEVWTGSAWELNQLRYYLAQAGAGDLKVLCPHSFPGKGQMIHIASISAEEVIWNASDRTRPIPIRLWVTGNAMAADQRMRFVSRREFQSDGSRNYTLSLFARKE